MPSDRATVPRPRRQLWQWLIISALISNVVEGAIRKWVLFGSGQAIYFLTDFIVLASYICFWFTRKDRTFIPENGLIWRWLVPVGLIICIGIFNPALGTIIVGVFGAKCYLLDALLIFTIPFFFSSKADMFRFFRYYLLIAIPVCLLGAVQFASSPNSVLNRYAAETTTVVTFGEAGEEGVRITGTFAYITGHAVFLLIMALLSLGVTGTERRLSTRIVSIVVLGLVIVNLFMSGTRAFVLIIGLMLFLSFLLFGFRRDDIGRRLRVLLIVGGLLGTTLVSIKFRQAYDAFLYRTSTSSETIQGRVFQEVGTMPRLADFAGFLGVGPGMTQPGGWALRYALHLPRPQVRTPLVEAEYARILVEIGMLGVVIWYGVRIALVIAIWKVYRRLRSAELRFWALLIFLLHLLTLDIGVVINHTFSIYYWFFAGVAFGLPRLEALEAQSAPRNAPVERFAYLEPDPTFAR